MTLSASDSMRGTGSGARLAEVTFVVLFSAGAGAAATAMLPYDLAASILWAEGYGLATLAVWYWSSNLPLARRLCLPALTLALVAGNLSGSLLGGVVHAANPFWLAQLETEALVRHSLTYLLFFVPAMMVVCWSKKSGDIRALAAEQERRLQEYRQDVARSEHLLLTTAIHPSTLVGVLENAARSMADNRIEEARTMLEATARLMRKLLADLRVAVPALSSPLAIPPEAGIVLQPGALSYRRLNFRLVACLELLIVATVTIESLFLEQPFHEIAIFVHVVGWAMIASCSLIAHSMRRDFADAIPLAGGVLLGNVIGKGLVGIVLMGDPLFMVRSPVGIRLLPVSLYFSVVAAVLIWQHGLSIKARTAYARTAAKGAEISRQLLTARTRLLKAQIEPHFLFNTLSNIIAHSYRDKNVAQEMIGLLVRLVGHGVGTNDRNDGTLRREIDGIRTYLRLQGLRIGSRLTWTVECPETLMTHPFPQLLLQPLVENSIRHGIEAISGDHSIKVHVGVEPARLTIDVADTGRGMQGGYVAGTGLANVRERLASCFGTAAELHFLPAVPRGLTVRLTIPRMSGT